MSETPVLWEETVQPGATWSHVLKRGTSLRITDLEGGANAGAIFYNFECPVERYNMPDTLKAQHIASPHGLAVEGGSNGGLLIGAVVNERPDLFDAAHPAVGVMDMLRFDKFTAGRYWVDDYGYPEKEAGADVLYREYPLPHTIDPAYASELPRWIAEHLEKGQTRRV